MGVIVKSMGLALAAGLACAGSLPARAQLPGAGNGSWGSGYGPRGTPVQAPPTLSGRGGGCVRWCVADASPCDPDYYKVADRRCNVNLNGYFPK